MANEEHLAILKQGVSIWNKWREEHPEIIPDLYEADLRKAELRGAEPSSADYYGAVLTEEDLYGTKRSRADLYLPNRNGTDLSEANLRYANLSGANLYRVKFNRADLRGTDLSETILSEADFSEANLRGTDFSRANLRRSALRIADLQQANLHQADLEGADIGGADFSRAKLDGVNLSHAQTAWTAFNDVDLSEVKGLDKVSHDGPSNIDIHTIYNSKGNIPEVFLRGAGVPDNFITYMKSLTGAPFEYYSCFISYSSKDQAFVGWLYADLQAQGVRCWYAPHYIQGGKKIHEQIDQAIRLHDKLLLVLSEHSMDSEWVKTEIYNARQLEAKENKRKLFPISLATYDQVRQWHAFDADIGKDMAREVREYFIPDFTNWKDHDAYQKAFDRLLRDLKA